MLEGLHSFGFYTGNLRMAEVWRTMGPQRAGDCRGLPVNCWGLPGTARNPRGQRATAGHCGGLPGLSGTARLFMNPINCVSVRPSQMGSEIY